MKSRHYKQTQRAWIPKPSLREELHSNSTKQSRAKVLRLPRRCFASPRNDGCMTIK